MSMQMTIQEAQRRLLAAVRRMPEPSFEPVDLARAIDELILARMASTVPNGDG